MSINAGQRSHAVRENLHGEDVSSVRNSGDKSSHYASHTKQVQRKNTTFDQKLHGDSSVMDLGSM